MTRHYGYRYFMTAVIGVDLVALETFLSWTLASSNHYRVIRNKKCGPPGTIAGALLNNFRTYGFSYCLHASLLCLLTTEHGLDSKR
jgi:hypothetical protein